MRFLCRGHVGTPIDLLLFVHLFVILGTESSISLETDGIDTDETIGVGRVAVANKKRLEQHSELVKGYLLEPWPA